MHSLVKFNSYIVKTGVTSAGRWPGPCYMEAVPCPENMHLPFKCNDKIQRNTGHYIWGVCFVSWITATCHCWQPSGFQSCFLSRFSFFTFPCLDKTKSRGASKSRFSTSRWTAFRDWRSPLVLKLNVSARRATRCCILLQDDQTFYIIDTMTPLFDKIISIFTYFPSAKF